MLGPCGGVLLPRSCGGSSVAGSSVAGLTEAFSYYIVGNGRPGVPDSLTAGKSPASASDEKTAVFPFGKAAVLFCSLFRFGNSLLGLLALFLAKGFAVIFQQKPFGLARAKPDFFGKRF